jgi:polyvinyl alcohol dehydrogenase (cytochrome)
MLSPNPGGMRAVNLATGEMAWSVDPQKPLCGEGRTCRASQGAAVTVIPGAVFSGSLDGGMRAYSTADGKISGPTTATASSRREQREGDRRRSRRARRHRLGGMLYFNSGYGGFVGNPGNVLLAFGVD